MFRIVVLLTLLAHSPFSFADNMPPELEISCADSPRGAVTEIPELVKDIARIRCTVYGHLITSAEDVAWGTVKGFSPVIVTAQIIQGAPKSVHHDSYFTSVSAKLLRKQKAKTVFKDLAQRYGKVPEDAPITIEIVATNQESITQKVYLFKFGPQTIWGYACLPKCRPDKPFIVKAYKR